MTAVVSAAVTRGVGRSPFWWPRWIGVRQRTGWRWRPKKWRAVLAVGGRALNCRRDRPLSTRRSPAAAIATPTPSHNAVARSVAYGEATWAVDDGDDVPLVVVNSAMVAEAGLSAATARRWRSLECRARLAVDYKVS